MNAKWYHGFPEYSKRLGFALVALEAIFALMLLIVLPHLAIADTPEYLKSENPIPDSLEKTPSVTQSIGVLPESRPLGDMLLPRQYFPELRKRIPTTGQPFFDDAVFHISPRAFFRNRDNGDGTKSEGLAVGGEFGVESGYFADTVRLGLTGYTSQQIYGPGDRGGSGLFSPNEESYMALGEAYADIKIEEANATVFRQRLDLPYLNAHDVRMTPNTFEAYTLRTTVVPKLQIGGGHIRKIKFRNSSDFEYLSAHAGATGTEKGVSVVGARYDFSEHTHIGFIEEYGWDMFNTVYTEVEGQFPLNDDWSLRAGVQFTDQRSVGDELLGEFDSQHLGGKLALGYGSLIASSSFTWTSRGNGVQHPWGGSPSYNSIMIGDFDRAGEKAIRAGLSYEFSKLGLDGVAASATWVYGDTPDSGSDASPDEQEFNVNVDYRPPIEGLDNFWLRFRYGQNESDAALGGHDRDDFRIILNYSFSF